METVTFIGTPDYESVLSAFLRLEAEQNGFERKEKSK